jgi:hypothetical protein
MRGLESPIFGMRTPFTQGADADADAYAVAGSSPKLVADFDGATEYYRKAGSATTFDGLFTHTGASLRTMVDSDGALTWAPHNLIPYSDDANSWPKYLVTVVVDQATGPDGASADLIYPTSTHIDVCIYQGSLPAVKKKHSVVAKAAGKDWLCILQEDTTGGGVWFNLSTGVQGTETANWTGTMTDLGDGWYLCTAEVSTGFNQYTCLSPVDGDASTTSTANGTDGIYVVNMHCLRNDLGGMVNVPSDARTLAALSSYVPTTSAAVHLPRRGHHIYNGSTWANKGIFLESEARTNLVASSDDMSGWTTSTLTVTKDQTGADGIANSANRLTATGANSTVLLTVTAASNPHVFGALVKRVTGTGVIEVTVDGGTTWDAVTSDINTSVYTQVCTDAQTVTNPQIGFRIVTSGDEIAVQINQLEQTSGKISSPIPTSGSTVTRAAETLTVPAANLPYDATNMSIAMKGTTTYADEGAGAQQTWMRWRADGSNYLSLDLDTDAAATGEVNANQKAATAPLDTVVAGAEYSPGINVAFNIASRNTAGAINVAKDGTAATEDTTPTSLPDLSATDLDLGYDFMGTIEQFLMWDADLGDAGIEEATS